MYVVRIQTSRGISHRTVSLARARDVLSAPLGQPAQGGVLCMWKSTPEYDAAGESVFRAKGGWLPVVWEWNGVGVS